MQTLDASEGLSCGLKSEAVYLFTAKVGRVTKSSQQKVQALQDLCAPSEYLSFHV